MDGCVDYWHNHFHKKKRTEVKLPPSQNIGMHASNFIFIREDEEQRINLKAMILSGILQTIVLLQEILVVVNVESGEHKWSAIFTPAYLFCLLCIGACIWSCWRSRGVEVMTR